jgi:CRISPR/Cas system-associated exonuclease Cas4 (RecB family)
MEDKGKLLVALRDSVTNRIRSLFASVAQSDQPRLRLSALGLCPRATVLSVRTGITADLTEAAGILAAGHLFENFIAEAFDGEEIYPQFEVALAGVTGHIDFYFPQRKFLIECKTIAAARCSPEFLPVEHHVVQVHAYLAALFEMTSEEHYAALVYFPRENPRLFQVFTFAYDPSWHSELVLRIELLKHAIETGEIPPIPAGYDATKFPCRWFSRISRMVVQCPFYDQCWQTKKQEQDEEPKEFEGSNEDNLSVYDMPDDLEELVALLHSIRTQKKSLDEQEKAARQQLLEKVGQTRGRWVGKEFGLQVRDEQRRTLDTKALSKVVNLDEYRKVTVATIVDVWRRLKL